MKSAWLALAATTAVPVVAQKIDHNFDFQPGDKVALHSDSGSFEDQAWVVASCRDRGDEFAFACDMRRVEPSVKTDPYWWTMRTYRNWMTLVARNQPIPGEKAAAANAPIRPPAAGNRAAATPAPVAAAATAGQCGAPMPDASRAAAFGASVARWAIYDNYARRAYGQGISSPISVGIAFDSLTVGRAEPNVVLNDPGRGAYLRNDAAPRGAMLYSVSSIYRVCDRYSNATRIRRFEARHVCFKDATGTWGCGIDGYPKMQSIQ